MKTFIYQRKSLNSFIYNMKRSHLYLSLSRICLKTNKRTTNIQNNKKIIEVLLNTVSKPLKSSAIN